MTDFVLEPDDSDPERPERRRPVRLVSTGLAPTADEPPPRRTPEPAPCYTPCEGCGTLVLVGSTPGGQRLALDTAVRTYVVDWDQGAPGPRRVESRGNPVHTCTDPDGASLLR